MVDGDADAAYNAAMGLHVVHVDFMPPVGQSACDIGAYEPRP